MSECGGKGRGDAMMTEWADDPGRRQFIRVRCARPEEDCGWTGNAAVVTQYGCTSLEIEECPECGGGVEESAHPQHAGGR